MGEDDGRVIIGQYADALSKEPGKENKYLALSLQHHNQGAAHAAQAHTFFDEVIISQFEEGSEYKKALEGVSKAFWSGMAASNSHEGKFLRDFTVKEHRVITPVQNAKGSVLDRLTGKSNANPQPQM